MSGVIILEIAFAQMGYSRTMKLSAIALLYGVNAVFSRIVTAVICDRNGTLNLSCSVFVYRGRAKAK